MKFTHLLKAAWLFLLVGSLTGCEELFKESETEADGSAPYVRLQAPTEKSEFKIGQNIKLMSTISDKDGIKEMEVQVVRLMEGAASQPVWGYKSSPSTNPVIVDTLISAKDLTKGHYMLRLNLIDKRTNIQVKEVNFSVK